MRQKLVGLQGEIHESTVLFGDFSTLLSLMDVSSTQKINEDTVEQHQ